jgi:3-methyladenine DNA glycosylase AlkD
MTDITANWRTDFEAAVARDDLPAAVAAVHSQATAHAGTAPAAEKKAAAKFLSRALSDDDLLRWACALASSDNDTAKEIGAILLARTYPAHRDEAIALLKRLADDTNWEVREWAGSAAGELLAQHFDELYPVFESWSRDEREFVRRAVCIAIRAAADKRKPERAEPLLAIADQLATDPAEEVKRNTGPFAVGGNLLSHYPEQTIAHVRRWASSDHEMLRWNAAMVFVAANARNHVDAALDVLSGLANDKRRPVWMAVASAAKNLAKRDPARVVPILESWLHDERKLPAALALRHRAAK